ncbi:MAG: hypothetical protein JWM56_1401 [Candidatus Peribacteria bacterium]|nr:hypothetical protein [Candidatus Peribacteria bacterium]
MATPEVEVFEWKDGERSFVWLHKPDDTGPWTPKEGSPLARFPLTNVEGSAGVVCGFLQRLLDDLLLRSDRDTVSEAFAKVAGYGFLDGRDGCEQDLDIIIQEDWTLSELIGLDVAFDVPLCRTVRELLKGFYKVGHDYGRDHR